MKEENTHNNKKLGRGLSALLGESKNELNTVKTKNAKLLELIDINRIVAGVYQPRKSFDKAEIAELAESIKENGLIQPIILRKIDNEEEKYEIIAGERRFRACKSIGRLKIPSIVKKVNNHEALEMAIIENVQREDLSLTEEATSYKQLITEFSYNQEQVAKRVGKSRSHITNLLRILGLPKAIRDSLDKKEFSMGHARAIINAEDPEALAKKIIKESLTVRDVEELVRDEKVEQVKNTPVLIRTESDVKFVNSSHLAEYEKRLSQLLEMDVKISYNSLKDSGKINLKFDNFDKLSWMISDLENIQNQEEK